MYGGIIFVIVVVLGIALDRFLKDGTPLEWPFFFWLIVLVIVVSTTLIINRRKKDDE